jgi:hypothetical protein
VPDQRLLWKHSTTIVHAAIVAPPFHQTKTPRLKPSHEQNNLDVLIPFGQSIALLINHNSIISTSTKVWYKNTLLKTARSVREQMQLFARTSSSLSHEPCSFPTNFSCWPCVLLSMSIDTNTSIDPAYPELQFAHYSRWPDTTAPSTISIPLLFQRIFF